MLLGDKKYFFVSKESSSVIYLVVRVRGQFSLVGQSGNIVTLGCYNESHRAVFPMSSDNVLSVFFLPFWSF